MANFLGHSEVVRRGRSEGELGTFLSVETLNSRSADPSELEVKSVILVGWKCNPRPPVLDAPPQILRLWPDRHFEQKRPPAPQIWQRSISALRKLEIWNASLMLRWSILTRAWLRAANVSVHKRFSRFPAAYAQPSFSAGRARVSVGSGICEQAGSLCMYHSCMYHSWGRTRSQQLERHDPRVKKCGPPASRRRLAAFSLGCPLGRSLPRLSMG